MRTTLMALIIIGANLFLAGCVTTSGSQQYRQDNDMITRDGIALPDCETLPDASQADNGSRCWYR
ncbi:MULTISPECIES: hypothetical protein [Aeromonas]|uniref:hypothetical protein n=1 Tax=Aeromonas TaxID=642 RepID=UPI0032EF3AF6